MQGLRKGCQKPRPQGLTTDGQVLRQRGTEGSSGSWEGEGLIRSTLGCSHHPVVRHRPPDQSDMWGTDRVGLGLWGQTISIAKAFPASHPQPDTSRLHVLSQPPTSFTFHTVSGALISCPPPSPMAATTICSFVVGETVPPPFRIPHSLARFLSQKMMSRWDFAGIL